MDEARHARGDQAIAFEQHALDRGVVGQDRQDEFRLAGLGGAAHRDRGVARQRLGAARRAVPGEDFMAGAGDAARDGLAHRAEADHADLHAGISRALRFSAARAWIPGPAAGRSSAPPAAPAPQWPVPRPARRRARRRRRSAG